MIAKRATTLDNDAPKIEDGDLVSVVWVTFAERRRHQAIYAKTMKLTGDLDVGIVVSVNEDLGLANVMFWHGCVARINTTRLKVISRAISESI